MSESLLEQPLSNGQTPTHLKNIQDVYIKEAPPALTLPSLGRDPELRATCSDLPLLLQRMTCSKTGFLSPGLWTCGAGGVGWGPWNSLLKIQTDGAAVVKSTIWDKVICRRRRNRVSPGWVEGKGKALGTNRTELSCQHC